MIFDRNNKCYQEDINNILASFDAGLLNNHSILVTGATGLIGTLIIDCLMTLNKKGANIKIYALGRDKMKASDRLGIYYNDNLFEFVEQDIRNPLPHFLVVDYIIHGASNAHPLAYSKDPIGTIMTNVKGTENVLNRAVECNARVLFMSTVEVYGNARCDDVFTEDYTGNLDLSNARACYPESKRLCEAMCQSYMAQKNVDVRIVRLSRVFGPTMTESDSKASAQFFKNAKAGKNIVLKSDGLQLYSYTYSADAVSAIFYVLMNGEAGIAYNVANEDCIIRLKDFAALCANFNGKEVVFELPSDSEKRGFSGATHAVLDNYRLISIGWKPMYNMEKAIRYTLSILN